MNDLCRVLLHALPVAWLAWTVTHEEIFRDWWQWMGDNAKSFHQKYQRAETFSEYYPLWRKALYWLGHKLCFLVTCEYCTSFWINLVVVLVSGLHILYDDWRGCCLAVFGVPWVAVLLMDLHQRLRVEIRKDRNVSEAVAAHNGKHE